MNKSLLLIAFTVFILACHSKPIKSTRLNSNTILPSGEWQDSSDTINGISIRKNLIAFYENNKFNSDQVREYFIIDSIYKKGKIETKVGEYLISNNLGDSIKYEIIKRNKQLIILEDEMGIQKKYKFWR